MSAFGGKADMAMNGAPSGTTNHPICLRFMSRTGTAGVC
jgi:hypothetical protein